MDGSTMPSAPLLQVEDLSVKFVTREATVNAVSGATFNLRAGEVLCLLGESGSGKSVTLRALMRLLPDRAKVAGRVQRGGDRRAGAEGAAVAGVPRRHRVDDLPGADDRARPGLHNRPASDGDDPAA